MSRSDYLRIAQALHKVRLKSSSLGTWVACTDAVGEALAHRNPSFDVELFKLNCREGVDESRIVDA